MKLHLILFLVVWMESSMFCRGSAGRVDKARVEKESDEVVLAEDPLSGADRKVLGEREKGRLALIEVEQHLRKIDDADERKTFIRSWLALEQVMIDRFRKDEIAKLEQKIADMEVHLKWSDSQLRKLDDGRSPVEIRKELAQRLQNEKARLKLLQKKERMAITELEGVKQELSAELR